MSKDNIEKFPKDDSEEFSKAQFHLGVIYYEQGETDKAIKGWGKIKQEDGAKLFFQSSRRILSVKLKPKNKLDKIDFWKKILENEEKNIELFY